ncbi:MAG: protein kinase [Planctomycetaceae bacterium]|nr:protein kinase [Planctomycetaceae bacterium]
MSKLPDFLGPYRLAKFIRSGNACQIWEAIRDQKDRFVLKVLRPDQWGDKDETAYLKHEFDVAGGLDHPSIIRIHEFNTEGKIAYIVLDVFSVLNIKQAMRENLAHVHWHSAKIAQQAAMALGHMHEKGWVHCDVKPDNFLLNEDGEIKLIDFTIARKAAKGMLGRMFGKAKVIRGTRSYMSPEQIRGQPVDGRSDIYALGCVYYELLTGKPPYVGDNPNDLLQRHLTAGIPSAIVYNEDVTSEMNDLIRRMLSKKAENRPQRMIDVVKELKSLKPLKVLPKLPEPEASQESSE